MLIIIVLTFFSGFTLRKVVTVVQPYIVPMACDLMRLMPGFKIIDKYIRCETVVYGITDWLLGSQNNVKLIH